jgi:endo-1,4-beta-mannosidase
MNDNVFFWGVGTHLLNRKENNSLLPLVNSLKMNSFRDDATWGAVELTAGNYKFPLQWDEFINNSVEAGVAPLLIIDYGNKIYDNGNKPISDYAQYAYVKYVKELVTHYKNKVHLYEIWNEWDTREPKSPIAYLKLLSESYTAIKSIDSNAIVLGGGIGPHSMKKGILGGDSWFDEFVKIGGLGYLDGLSVHPYVHCEKNPTPEGFLKLLKQMILATSSSENLPIYITEMGWANNIGDCGVTPEQARAYMIEAYLIARCIPQVKGLWWYDLIDDGTDLSDREHNFGIYEANRSPKKAYDSAKVIGQMNNNISCIESITTNKELARYHVKSLGLMDYKELLYHMSH